MRKTVFAAILFAAAIASSAQAGESNDPLKKWVDELKAAKANITEQVAKMENMYVSFCSETAAGAANLQACLAAYQLVIATAKKDAAVLDFKLAAAQTEPKVLAEMLKVVPDDEVNREGDASKRRSKLINQLFTRKTAQK